MQMSKRTRKILRGIAWVLVITAIIAMLFAILDKLFNIIGVF